MALELARIVPISYFGTPGRLFLRAPDAQTMLDIFVTHCDMFGDRLEMLGEVRYVNAMGMLADKSLSIDEIGFRLGFESDRGFRKAFTLVRKNTG